MIVLELHVSKKQYDIINDSIVLYFWLIFLSYLFLHLVLPQILFYLKNQQFRYYSHPNWWWNIGLIIIIYDAIYQSIWKFFIKVSNSIFQFLFMLNQEKDRKLWNNQYRCWIWDALQNGDIFGIFYFFFENIKHYIISIPRLK